MSIDLDKYRALLREVSGPAKWVARHGKRTADSCFIADCGNDREDVAHWISMGCPMSVASSSPEADVAFIVAARNDMAKILDRLEDREEVVRVQQQRILQMSDRLEQLEAEQEKPR